MRWIAALAWAVVFMVGWCVAVEVFWQVGMLPESVDDAYPVAFETGTRLASVWVIVGLVLGGIGAACRALPGTRGSQVNKQSGGGLRVLIAIAWLGVAAFTAVKFKEIGEARAAGKTTLTPEQQQRLKETQAQVASPPSKTKAPPGKNRSKMARPVPDLPGHYSYTDAKGTKHIVKGFDKVPERYR